MVVPVGWDRRHRRVENRRTRTFARGDWLGGLRALTLYSGQNNAAHQVREMGTLQENVYIPRRSDKPAVLVWWIGGN